MITWAALRSLDRCLSSSVWVPPEATARMCLAKACSVATLVQTISTSGNTSFTASEVEAKTVPCSSDGNSQTHPSRGLVVELITISSTVALPLTWVLYTSAGTEKARFAPHTTPRTIQSRRLSLWTVRGPKATFWRLSVVHWKALSVRVTQHPTARHHTHSSMKTLHHPEDRYRSKPRSDTKIGTVRKSELSRFARDRCTRIRSEGGSLRGGVLVTDWNTW